MFNIFLIFLLSTLQCATNDDCFENPVKMTLVTKQSQSLLVNLIAEKNPNLFVELGLHLPIQQKGSDFLLTTSTNKHKEKLLSSLPNPQGCTFFLTEYTPHQFNLTFENLDDEQSQLLCNQRPIHPLPYVEGSCPSQTNKALMSIHGLYCKTPQNIVSLLSYLVLYITPTELDLFAVHTNAFTTTTTSSRDVPLSHSLITHSFTADTKSFTVLVLFDTHKKLTIDAFANAQSPTPSNIETSLSHLKSQTIKPSYPTENFSLLQKYAALWSEKLANKTNLYTLPYMHQTKTTSTDDQHPHPIFPSSAPVDTPDFSLPSHTPTFLPSHKSHHTDHLTAACGAQIKETSAFPFVPTTKKNDKQMTKAKKKARKTSLSQQMSALF